MSHNKLERYGRQCMNSVSEYISHKLDQETVNIANKSIYLVREQSSPDYSGELYTWGYYSDLSKAIKLVEELKKSSNEDEFPSTNSLFIQVAPLNVPEFDRQIGQLPKRYTLYKANGTNNKTLVKNQEDWDRLREDN